ncbi:uncharacterized protein LOC144124225 [Amblyomma americanum]
MGATQKKKETCLVLVGVHKVLPCHTLQQATLSQDYRVCYDVPEVYLICSDNCSPGDRGKSSVLAVRDGMLSATAARRSVPAVLPASRSLLRESSTGSSLLNLVALI